MVAAGDVLTPPVHHLLPLGDRCRMPPAAALEFYLSPHGDDTAPGTAAAPFATLARAQAAVRARLRQGALPAGGITVWLRGGDYLLDASFALTAEDSGSAAAPVSYRGVPGERARLLGGRVLTQWAPVQGPATRARLQPAARDAVRVADLRAHGVTDCGAFVSRGFNRPVAAAHLELFFHGAPMTVAQWPDAGEFLRIAGFVAPMANEWNSQVGRLDAGFTYAAERPRTWAPNPDLWVHGYWAYDWANSYEHVAQLDPASGTVVTAPPHGLYSFTPGQRFYFLNILEELDQPGDYYVDRAAGLLYFWPPSPLGASEALVSLLATPLVSLTDAAHVTLRDLVLEGGRSHGLTITGGTHNEVLGCTVRHCGNWGIVAKGGTHHTVAGCEVAATGDGAIEVSGGDRLTLARADHRVHNCHLHHFGRWSRSYQAGILASGCGLTLSHNRIHDAPHNGILFWGNDILIDANELYRVCLEAGDVGAIYTGRDYTFRGNVIRHNYLHHLGGYGMGSNAIYLDDNVSGHEITGNIVWGGDGIWLGGGRDHVIENNVFVDCKAAISFDNRGCNPNPVWHAMVYTTMKERFYAVRADQPLYLSRYPALAPLPALFAQPGGIPAEHQRVRRNVVRGGWLRLSPWALAEEAWLHQADNLLAADPCFTDALHGDFQLRADSPAWALGFQRIPTESIGLVLDAYRATLPER